MEKYLKPLLKNNHALFLAYDHGLEHGPKDLIGPSLDPNYILQLTRENNLTGVILQGGVAEQYYFRSPFFQKIPLILKINGKTNLYQTENPYSPITWDITDAKRLGASAIGYTIYLGSAYEYKMFSDFNQARAKAHQIGLAAIAWIYPRGKYITNDTSEEITAYAARVGLELGADMIKIKYSGSSEAFQKAVQVAGKTRVVLSGGPKTDEEEFLEIVKQVIKAGACGVAVGRNVWQADNPQAMLKKIKEIIWSSQTA